MILKVIFLLGWLACSCAGRADTNPVSHEIRVGFIEFSPAIFTNDAGEVDGWLHERLVVLLDKAGYRGRFQSLPAKRLMNDIADGEVDLWIGPKHVPALVGRAFVAEPVLGELALNAYWMGDTPPVRSINELPDGKVIIQHGYSYGGVIDSITQKQDQTMACKAYNDQQALNMLLRHRCDYLVGYAESIDSLLVSVKVPALRRHTIAKVGVTFVVSRKSPRGSQLLQDLVSAYISMPNA